MKSAVEQLSTYKGIALGHHRLVEIVGRTINLFVVRPIFWLNIEA